MPATAIAMEDLAPSAPDRRVSHSVPASFHGPPNCTIILFLRHHLVSLADGLLSRWFFPQAAVRYVRSVSADHQIDPTRVAIMGDSAGAVTSLYVG